jgi:hypothetical protein
MTLLMSNLNRRIRKGNTDPLARKSLWNYTVWIKQVLDDLINIMEEDRYGFIIEYMLFIFPWQDLLERKTEVLWKSEWETKVNGFVCAG